MIKPLDWPQDNKSGNYIKSPTYLYVSSPIIVSNVTYKYKQNYKIQTIFFHKIQVYPWIWKVAKETIFVNAIQSRNLHEQLWYQSTNMLFKQH